jgi:acetyl esterase
MRRFILCAGQTIVVIAVACLLGGENSFAAEASSPAGARGTALIGGGPTPPPTNEDVAYGPHTRNMLDYWQAKSERPTPVLIYMHGGSFFLGDKVKIRSRPIIDAYLQRGVSFASINYRFRQDAPLQDILRDAGRAIQFLRYHAQEFNIDKPRIAMYGESAGAGTSLWLAAHPDLADRHNADPVLRESSRPVAAGCIDGQATYDITQWDQLVGAFKPEWLLNPNEIVQLYHFQSEADFKTSQGREILEDCDMLHWLSRDTAPIFMFSDVRDVEPKIRQDYVHHPRHMAVVKRQCNAVGAQCTVLKREDLGSPVEHNGLLMEFMLKQLKVE